MAGGRGQGPGLALLVGTSGGVLAENKGGEEEGTEEERGEYTSWLIKKQRGSSAKKPNKKSRR